MHRILNRLPAGWPYVASIILTKGFSVISIPLLANFIAPAEYSRLDVAASFIEFLGLIFAMGLADTLIRFTSLEADSTKRNKVASEIIGTALLLALALGIIVQLLVPTFLNSLPIVYEEGAIRAGFFAATLSGLIALPLAWVRLKDQPLMFLLYTGTRGVLQAVTTIGAAWAGYGIEAILYTNAVVDILISTVILTIMVKETGLTFKMAAFKRTCIYGLPLLGGALAMFVLGALDRWFLVGYVPAHDLAHYAVATKFALVAPLLMQPFVLWWSPQRYRVLEEKDGLQRSAEIVGMGFTFLLISATIISLIAPLFIHWTMPAEYMQATLYLPWLIGIAVLHESNTLLNVGVYLKKHAFLVLLINSVCAIVALTGYWLFVPDFGIVGAIAATIAAQALRLVLFVTIGHHAAPIPYPFLRTGILAMMTTAFIWFSPSALSSIALIGWAISGVVILAVTATMLGLVRISLPRPGFTPKQGDHSDKPSGEAA